MDQRVKDCIEFAIYFWLLFYGAWSFIVELSTSVFPNFLILIIATLAAIAFFRNPPPDKRRVKAIVGRDPIDVDEDKENDFVIRTIAHRGAALDAPENSLAAFKYCVEKGCDAIEFDLSMTKDNVPIIFHDNTITRVSGKPGVIKEMTWEELSKVNIAATHPSKDRFPDVRIAKFDETIDFCIENDVKMFIDLKENDKKVIKVLLDTFHKKPVLYSRAIVSGFNPYILYMLRRADPKIVCSMAYRPGYFTYKKYDLSLKELPRRYNNIFKHTAAKTLDYFWDKTYPLVAGSMIGISTIFMHKDAVNNQWIETWRKRGVRVVAWTVNLPTEKQNFRKTLRVTYITDTLIGESLPKPEKTEAVQLEQQSAQC